MAPSTRAAAVVTAFMIGGCSFPTLRFSPELEGGRSDGNPADAGGTADASGDVDPESPASRDPCDVDGDGYRAVACGGSDCDDLDPRANPGVVSYLTFRPTETTHGDWDCDGTVDKQYHGGFSCESLPSGQCGKVTGFAVEAPCGDSAFELSCTSTGESCTVAARTETLQGCR